MNGSLEKLNKNTEMVVEEEKEVLKMIYQEDYVEKESLNFIKINKDFQLKFKFPEDYPNFVPELELLYKGELDQEKTKSLFETSSQFIGKQMIFDIVQLVTENFDTQNEEKEESKLIDIEEEKKELQLNEKVLFYYTEEKNPEMSLEKYIEFTDQYRWNNVDLNEELNLVFHTSVSIRGTTYIFGGLSGTNFNSKLYRIHENQVKEVLNIDGKLPTGRAFHSMNYTRFNNEDYIIIYGGYDKKLQITSDIFILKNPSGKASWFFHQSNSIPALAGHSTAIFKDSKLLVFGGMYGKDKWSDDAFLFSIPQKTVQRIQLQNKPPARSGHSMIIINNLVYIFGGFNENGVLDDFWSFRLDQEEPVCTHVKQPGVSLKICHANTLFNMTFGGFTGENWVNYTYKLDIEHCQWTLLFSENSNDKPAAFQSVCQNNYDYFMTGGYQDEKFFYDYEKQIKYVQDFDDRAQYNNKIRIYEYNKSFLSDVNYNPSILRENARKNYKIIFETQDPKLSDLIFLLDNEPIYSHRFVLYQIPKFKKIIESQDSQSLIKINISKSYPEIERKPFEIFLLFIYTRSFYLDDDYFSLKREKLPITKLYKIAEIFECDFLKEILLHKVNFNTIYPTSFTLSIYQLFVELIKPIPLSKMESFTVLNGHVNLITSNSFSEDSEQFFVSVSKTILSERSPYFKMMFESQFRESTSIDVEITELTTEGLLTVLKYLYAGMVPNIKPENCIEIYLVIHKYQLTELTTYLRTTIRENTDESNVFSLYEISSSLEDNQMSTFCTNYIAKRLETLQQTEEYESLSKNLKDGILSKYYQMVKTTSVKLKK